MPSATMRAEIFQSVPGLQDTLTVPEAASQSFKAGQFVRIGIASDTGNDGQLIACAGDANELVLGIAQQDASGTTNTEIPVQLIYPGVTQVVMSSYNAAGAASSITAAANVGKTVGFKVVSNKCVANQADIGGSSGDEIFKIVEIDGRYAVGAEYGRFVCTLKAANSQLSA